jgi:predicted short-subunit dehydrogenase-like oxidoreductase (DUF2520 family)
LISRPTLAFIGAGKVGSVLARAWRGCGYDISAIYSRNPDHAFRLATEVGAAATVTLDNVIAASDLILLTVADDALSMMMARLHALALHGKAVIHTSGVHSLDVLRPVALSGAMTGSLHPAFPFANADILPEQLAGTVFALESDTERLTIWMRDLVSALNGRWMTIPPGGKATYHAAMTIASNFMVTLYAIAEKLLLDLGIHRENAEEALNALLAGSVANLHKRGVPDALTGAFVRGDVQTIHAHLTALRHDDAILEMYRTLAQLTLPIAEGRGTPADMIAAMSRALADQRDNAHA